MLSIIAAMSENWVIGKDGGMPWGRIPEDLKHFQRMTMGKTIVMGRKTFESIGSRALPGRRNIVLTSNKDFSATGITVVHDIETILDIAAKTPDMMIIGGSSLYKAFLPYVDYIFLTHICTELEGDTFFPEFNMNEWENVIPRRIIKKSVDNPYDLIFTTFQRRY